MPWLRPRRGYVMRIKWQLLALRTAFFISQEVLASHQNMRPLRRPSACDHWTRTRQMSDLEPFLNALLFMFTMRPLFQDTLSMRFVSAGSEHHLVFHCCGMAKPSA